MNPPERTYESAIARIEAENPRVNAQIDVAPLSTTAVSSPPSDATLQMPVAGQNLE